jgi:hypothetical protein
MLRSLSVSGRRPDWHSPDAGVLQQRGIEHERAYLAHLEASGIPVTELRDIESDGDSLAPVVSDASRHHSDKGRDETGAAAIAQAALTDGRWFGRADVLRRVDCPRGVERLGLGLARRA